MFFKIGAVKDFAIFWIKKWFVNIATFYKTPPVAALAFWVYPVKVNTDMSYHKNNTFFLNICQCTFKDEKM